MGADQVRHLQCARTHVISRAIVDRNSAIQTAATIRIALPQMAGSNLATGPRMFVTARSLRDYASIRPESAQLRKIRKSCAKALPHDRPDPFARNFSSPPVAHDDQRKIEASKQAHHGRGLPVIAAQRRSLPHVKALRLISQSPLIACPAMFVLGASPGATACYLAALDRTTSWCFCPRG